MKKLLFGLLGLLVTISGWSAETNSGPISSVTVAGLVAQNGTPTPNTPVDIVSNNGVLKVRHQSGLPLGYTELQYVKAPSGSYVVTNIVPTYDGHYELSIQTRSVTTSAVTYLGSRDEGSGNGGLRFAHISDLYFRMSGFGDASTSTTKAESNVDYKFVWNNGTGSIYSGSTLMDTNTFPSPTMPTTTPLAINGWNSNGVIGGNLERIYIYSFKAWNAAGILIGNYIPAKNSSNVVGLYDTVSDTFFTNQGTGTFTAGDPVSDPVEIYTDGTVETIADSANHTATVATLLGVGDYRDTQNINTGAITRNVGVKVLDGTENWSVATTSVLQADVLPNNVASTTSNTSLCSHLQYTTSSTLAGMPEYSFKNGTTTYPNRMYVKSSTLATDTTTWKQYLSDQYAAGTPVIVIYPLATATTESVAGQTMTTAPVNNRTGGVTGMTITTLLSSGTSVVTTIATNAIKIATTAYNSARFSPVVNDLNTTIATIRDVVTNTINQTAAIADLQATKQTRPADDYTDETNTENCPKFRQCLLVEDDNGTPHWYLIKDPVRDLVKSLRDNKINSDGETTTTAYAANGTTNSRYYKGYPAMRKLADGSTSVNTRQFGAALTGGDNGGQYKTLSDQEWAVTWNGNETGTAGSFLPGVIYGISRCSKVKPSSTAVGTEGWTTIENSDPVNDAENIQSYLQCYCKMTGVGVDGEFTPVRDSSRAPWVFTYTNGSAADCADYCAADCASDVRLDASVRSAVLGWAVE